MNYCGIDFPIEDGKRIAMKLSGGADSAIVLYSICKALEDMGKKNEKIVVFTTVLKTKPYQKYYTSQIIDWLEERFSVTFEQIANYAEGLDDYVPQQTVLRNQHEDKFDVIFAGVNKIPPSKVVSKFKDPGPNDNRSELHFKRVNNNSKVFCLPLFQSDKSKVAELYDFHDVRKTLLPLTRSCEGYGDLQKPCMKCWWCEEKHWAFGEY